MTAADHTPEQIASAYVTLDLALAHREALDMGTWVSPTPDGLGLTSLEDLEEECGTTACYAGWHAARLGHTFDEDGEVWMPDGGYVHVAELARKDLGLTDSAAYSLFEHTDGDFLAEEIAYEFGPRPDSA